MTAVAAGPSASSGGAHPAVVSRQLRDFGLLAGSVLIPLALALAVSIAVSRPSLPLLLGVSAATLGVAVLVTSSRYEVTVMMVVLYLGLLDGPVKLIVGGTKLRRRCATC